MWKTDYDYGYIKPENDKRYCADACRLNKEIEPISKVLFAAYKEVYAFQKKNKGQIRIKATELRKLHESTKRSPETGLR